MKHIDLTSLHKIPVYIENDAYRAVAYTGYEWAGGVLANAGLGNVQLEFHTDYNKFETARATAGYGVAGVQHWENIKNVIGSAPIINEWNGGEWKGMVWGAPTTSMYKGMIGDLTTMLKHYNWHTNVVVFRGEGVDFPTIEGCKTYTSDISPNTLLQKEVAFFDANQATFPVGQSPFASFGWNMYLELDTTGWNTRRMTASLHRDSYTWINRETHAHIARPTMAGFTKAFNSLLWQAGVTNYYNGHDGI